jgi:hypothetical protein
MKLLLHADTLNVSRGRKIINEKEKGDLKELPEMARKYPE